ncbi:hypothetical protein ACA910_016380 [Epithemia clementina (nom. ined.)]
MKPQHDGTKQCARYRVVEWNEVKETWDNETSSSWSQITLNEKDDGFFARDDDKGFQNRNLNFNAYDDDGEDVRHHERLTPPSQIHIPKNHDLSSSFDSEDDEDYEDLGLQLSTASKSEEEEGSDVHLVSYPEEGQRLSHPTFSGAWWAERLAVLPSPPFVLFRLYNSIRSKQQQQKHEEEMKANCHNQVKQYRRRSSIIESKPTRFFSIALLLWILELILLITLKRVGVIEPEFRLNEAVAQRVLASVNDTRWVPAMVQSLKIWGNESFGKSLTYLTQEKKRPGFQLAQKGAQAKYPLLIIPGFVTSGLEVWGGKECARKHFRQRMWAALVGARSFFSDRDCWRQHMMLDPWTGLDPEGIRLRASIGFEAVDYFLVNYWVFGKIIENLADVGYTPSEMSVEPYDWRLAFPMLEKRDGYFSRLKTKIETMHRFSGKKVVLTSHSMGVLVVHYFFAWVTAPEGRGGGGGGSKWVDKHVHAFVNIAGTHLGVPKALSSLLSGEMSDTVLMNPMATAVEQFFGRKLRQELWTTWGSIWAMLPKGGDALWGSGADMCNETIAGEDPLCPGGDTKMAQFLAVTDSKESIDEIVGLRHAAVLTWRRNNLILHHHNHTKHVADNQTGASPIFRQFMALRDFSMEATLDYLQAYGGGYGSKLANAQLYRLYGSPSNPLANRNSEPAWHDPTQTPLPHAPNMRIYCLYGVGRPTERAYHYKLNRPDQGQGSSDDQSNHLNTSLLQPPLVLDSEVSKPDEKVIHGVKYSDGDGSVPLLSLGYLCADAYQRPSSGLNPSKSAVYTREYPHRPEFTVDDPMRSGPKSADHVDVLGNVDMTTDLLRVLTDFEVEKVNENKIHSDIYRIAEQINAKGGIFKRGKNQRERNGNLTIDNRE